MNHSKDKYVQILIRTILSQILSVSELNIGLPRSTLFKNHRVKEKKRST